MQQRRWNGFILTAILIALIATACGGPSEPTKGDLTVYVAVPLSGFQANGGQTVLGGVRLAADEFNRAGGLLGYKLVVVPLDDESDSDVAVSLADQVKSDIASGKRVLGLIGHYNSGQTLAAMEIYKDLPIVVLTPTASEVSLTQKGYTNFFRINANDATQARVDAQFLVSKLGAKKVAIVHNDDPYGIGLGQALSDELGKLGAATATQIQVKVEQSEYVTEVQQLKAAAPDAIFYAGYEVETPYLRNALVNAGVKVPFMASDGAFLSATIDESDGTAEGMYLSLPGGRVPQPRHLQHQRLQRDAGAGRSGEESQLDRREGCDRRPARDRSDDAHRPHQLRRQRRSESRRSAHLHLPGSESGRRAAVRASAAMNARASARLALFVLIGSSNSTDHVACSGYCCEIAAGYKVYLPIGLKNF
jgi:branched-chain amino acid transport system substrate-binding protein